MREININVHVQIGVTDGLCALLSAFADNGRRQHGFGERLAEPQPTPAQLAPTPAKQPEPVEAPAEVVEQQPASAAPADEPAQAPAADPAPAEEKELTEVDVRAAMDRTRRRIEGEDYKENTTGEGYKKWHRALTGWFKNTAALHGADKPSALPDHASRKAFIADCDELIIKNGELTVEVPS